MNWLNESVLWISMFGALVAVVVTAYALRFVAGWIRLGFILNVIFAGVYALSYFWLIANPTRGGEWSRTLRPVGMASWWIGPWTMFPLTVMLRDGRLRQKIVDVGNAALPEGATIELDD